MKRISTRKAAHKRAVDPVRRRFVENVGRCEKCGSMFENHCHEIASGAAKEACELHPGLWICLCNVCHDEVQGWPKARQMAFRFKRSLETLNAITGNGCPTRFTLADVLEWWEE